MPDFTHSNGSSATLWRLGSCWGKWIIAIATGSKNTKGGMGVAFRTRKSGLRNSAENFEHSTSQSFKTLCNGRKTQSITSILLEAIYQTYFSHIEVKNEISVEDVRNWKNLRPIEESRMLEPRIPKCIRRGGLTLYTLELHELRSKVENFEKWKTAEDDPINGGEKVLSFGMRLEAT